MKIFVAGGTGVLGRPSVRALVEAGHQVRGTARGAEKAEMLRSLGAEPIEADLFDAESVGCAVAGCDAIINLATKIPPLTKVRWKGAWRENDRLRGQASRVMADAAAAGGVGTYIQESITFMYADGADAWLDEEAALDVSWIALQSMLEAERAVQRFGEASGHGISLRFAAFYAPYAQSTLDTIRLARRRMIPIPGRGDNYLSSIHVDDAATAVVAALDVAAGVYNVTDDEPLRMRDYAGAIAEAMGTPPPRRLPRWLVRLVLGGPGKYILRSQRVSNARFKTASGWSPRYRSAREGWQAIAEELRGDGVVMPGS